MRVHTFFSPVPELDLEGEYKLLLLWQRHWSGAGYDPAVLTERHAQAHPLYAEFKDRVLQLPTVNPRSYETACYLRYLAMAQAGGGWMLDVDLFPRRPNSLPRIDSGELLTSLQGHIPCCVYGSSNAFLEACRLFMTYQVQDVDLETSPKPDQAHVSDMTILERSGFKYVTNKQVWDYMEPGWEKVGLVHFSKGVLDRYGKLPKWKHIPELI